MTRVRSLARELKMYLGLGFAEKRDGRMYNSMAVFSPQGAAVALADWSFSKAA